MSVTYTAYWDTWLTGDKIEIVMPDSFKDNMIGYPPPVTYLSEANYLYPQFVPNMTMVCRNETIVGNLRNCGFTGNLININDAVGHNLYFSSTSYIEFWNTSNYKLHATGVNQNYSLYFSGSNPCEARTLTYIAIPRDPLVPGYDGCVFVLDDITTSVFKLYTDGTTSTSYPTTTFWNSVEPSVSPSIDPYTPGGISYSNGGDGNHDNSSDTIDFPSLPAINASDLGFITLYNPTLAELRNLSDYMWGASFDIATLKKLFADPMDAIMGLSLIPVAVTSGGTGTVHVGNVNTGVSMTLAGGQFFEVDCGSLDVDEYFGAYLDYDPYTKAEIYLPYIGTHAIAVDDIMHKTVAVKYHVDVLSGACVAYIKCGSSILYNYIGQCSVSIPFTSLNYNNAFNGALSIAGSIGTMIATGGVTAPLVAGIASTAFNSGKPSIQKSGALAGTGGFMSPQKPYLIITRPRQAMPNSQNKFTGYPSFITTTLSQLSGYTEVYKIHLEGMSCTDAEARELESILKEGAIF